MNYEIVKMDDFTGDGATIYSVVMEDDPIPLFEHFIHKNIKTHQKEVIDIVKRVKVIGSIGARENFFKQKEGKPGDLVCALYDEPDSNLRVYCLRFGSIAVILGGGGHKPKTIRALQEDPILTKENEIMKIVSQDLYRRLKEGEIQWSSDGKELLGNLNFTDDEEEC